MEIAIDKRLELINQLNFKIGIQSYSNIGRLPTFNVELEEGIVTPDDYVQWEINFNLNGCQASVEANDVKNNGEAGDEFFNPNAIALQHLL